MKAVILAAGKGERLNSLIQNIPKPMINFRGKPILQHNIELCRAYGIVDIYINTHHLPDKIIDYFGDGSKFGVRINYSVEKEPLGTSGAINNFKEYLCRESFFVVYGDNYSNLNLSLLLQKHINEKSICTIAFHHREDVSHSGVAEFDENLRIKKFIEKPKKGESDSHWVNAGIYALSSDIINEIPEGFSDFGKDIFPNLLKNNKSLYGVCYNSEVISFDTVEMYNKSINE